MVQTDFFHKNVKKKRANYGRCWKADVQWQPEKAEIKKMQTIKYLYPNPTIIFLYQFA